ncbi:MAG: poly-beta-1,6-N-acetyl-D-glucosamine N-deacetylase PgaB [Nitrospiraceae bacterium]|nr:MAG: poly-beta-1,6-N-acetyl-D-glucosamine N-deacetylase PgaB [Nitrospiraceae bacterium]
MIKNLGMTILFMYLLLCIPGMAAAGPMNRGEFLVLCYHAIPLKAAPGDNYSISRQRFVEHMEYLRTHGYNPVSFRDILEAREGGRALPEKPVLLTFDDAYVSYYEFVVPVLEELGYPSVLAVVGNFIEYPPKELPEPLMTWEQIREVSSNKLVTVASHSYNLHRAVQYTPQGNVAPSSGVLAFHPDTNSYETEAEYRARLDADFREQKNIFKSKLGYIPTVFVWPYGEYNRVSLDIAEENGFSYTVTLDRGPAHTDRLDRINRLMVENSPMNDFIRMLAMPQGERKILRTVQVDLDLVVDPSSPAKTDKNLGRLIDRLVEMKVNAVFLQAFADPDGSGNVENVYFHNRVLPVRADVFGWAAHQIMIRGIEVFAWMPTLSVVLPDRAQNDRLRVREMRNGESVPSTSWYRRLSPFSEETAELVRTIYEDLASHSRIRGVLFQDDAYLTDYEDFHPAAVNKYAAHFGDEGVSEAIGDDSEKAQEWARFKTEALINFTGSLKEAVKKYRPTALFARNIYAQVMETPAAELWFAQDYELFLKNYDYVVAMAYPQMEEVRRPSEWLKSLVATAQRMPQGPEKTIYKIQAYDWKEEAWIKDRILLDEMRAVLSSGGKHLAYYPDNFREDAPALNIIKLEISTKTFPFIP